jgi:hypothetical protein
MTSMSARSRLVIGITAAVLFAMTSIATAAPQAYLVRGVWTDIGTPVGATKNGTYEMVFLYDPTPYDATTNPTGALDVTAKADAEDRLAFPGYESWYRLPSPTLGSEGFFTTPGPNGFNYLDVDLANPNNPDFPRAKIGNSGGPIEPAIIKVFNDVPDFANGDTVAFGDGVDMTSIGLSPANGLGFFFFNIGVLSNRDLPADLDGDVFNPINPWGLDYQYNFGLTDPLSLDQIPLGDASRDGIVDGADYTVWADNYLDSFATGALWKQADFTIDGQVDGADYTVWADHYLEEIPLSPAAMALAAPEPSSLVLALGGGVLIMARMALVRRRRRAHR